MSTLIIRCTHSGYSTIEPVKCQIESYTAPYKYVLTYIDRATRWTEAIPMTDVSVATVAVSFLEVWISRFGVPLHVNHVITDCGSQFESKLFLELSTLIGFHRIQITSYQRTFTYRTTT